MRVKLQLVICPADGQDETTTDLITLQKDAQRVANLAGIAPDTGALTRLFHPRTDVWEEHFRLDENGQILGLTAIGRTTAYVLDMNSEIRIHIRQEILRLASKDDA